jgi:hypothetical protein
VPNTPNGAARTVEPAGGKDEFKPSAPACSPCEKDSETPRKSEPVVVRCTLRDAIIGAAASSEDSESVELDGRMNDLESSGIAPVLAQNRCEILVKTAAVKNSYMSFAGIDP